MYKTTVKKPITTILSAIFILPIILTIFMFPILRYDFSAHAEITDDMSSTVYYVSDNPGSQTLVESLVDYGYARDVMLYCYPKDKEDAYDGMIEYDDYKNYMRYIEYIYSHELYNIKNAYVIFEWADKQSSQFYDYQEIMPDVLENIFSGLQDNGCKIMFICGTDEMRFFNHNQFLDHVDIHVNTDLFFTFITNALYNMAQNCDGRIIEGTTIIFDNTFLTGDDPGLNWINEWVFKEYIITYFKTVFIEDMFFNGYTLSETLDEHHGVRLLCHIKDDVFMDLLHPGYTMEAYFDYYFFDHFLMNDHVYVVSTTWKGEEYSKNFLLLMSDIYAALGLEKNYEVFMYNQNNVDFSDDAYGKIYQMVSYYEYELLWIMKDFISGEEMASYDNWDGRCVVTHKMIRHSENGWVKDVYSGCDYTDTASLIYHDPFGGFFIIGWMIYQPYDWDTYPPCGYDYFFGTHNLF